MIETTDSDKKMNNICYWCGEKATSREHIPPLCLFPEEKDIGIIFKQSFRKNLITVPSCNEHNSKKSNDDEYLLVCLSSKIGNNELALAHTYTKIKRTLEHNPTLLPKGDDSRITIGEYTFPVSQVKIKNPRLMHSFEGIARGLYFHEYNKVFFGSCTIITQMLQNPNTDNKSRLQNLLVERMIETVNREKLFWKTEIKGSNPKVFKYQFSPKDGFDSQVLWMNFYEKTDIYVAFGYEEKLDKISDREFETLTAIMLGIDISSGSISDKT